MKTVFRGDAVPVAQVTHVIPANVQVGDIFTLSINGKSISYTAEVGTPADVVSNLVSIWLASTVPEFKEITAAQGTASDGTSFVILTANTAGIPFEVIASTSNTTTATLVTVTETVKGVTGVNEMQEVKFDGSYTGGTFTLFFNGQTTAAIAYNATAAAVQTALEGLSNIAIGDVAVTGASPDWVVEFKGAYAATDVSMLIPDGSNLTGTNLVITNTIIDGFAGSDQIQKMLVTANAGSYRLGLDNIFSAPSSDFTAAGIQATLESLPNVGIGNVVVTGYRGFNLIRFTRDMGGQHVNEIVIDSTNITSGSMQIGFDNAQYQNGGLPSFDTYQLVIVGNPTGGSMTMSLDTGTAVETFGPIYVQGTQLMGGIQGIGTVVPPVAQNSYTFSDQILHAILALYVRAGYLTVDDATTLLGIGGYNGLIFPFWIDSGSLGGEANGVSTIGSFVIRQRDWTTFLSLAGKPHNPFILDGTNLTGSFAPASVVVVNQGGTGTGNEVQSISVQGNGGTFTLTFKGQTTGALAYGSSSATIQTALEGLSTIGVGNVVVSGASPNYVATFIGTLADSNQQQTTGDGTNLTGGSITINTSVASVTPVNEQQTITLADDVDGGTFTLSYDGQGPTNAIAYNASAATIKTELELLSNIDLVTVVSTGPWVVTFQGVNAALDIVLMTADGTNLTTNTGTQDLVITENTRSEGPNHWDSPRNWTLNQIPNSGDDVIVDSNEIDLLYGLSQRVDFTADVSTDKLTFANRSHFRNDQIVRVRNSGGALPGGLSAATDYYIINLDRDTKTCQLSLTKAGSAITLTSAGTGTHTVGVELNSLLLGQRFTGALGLPQHNDSEYFEYRDIYLKIGLLDPVSGINKKVLIGQGEGAGSGRLRVDLNGSEPDIEVIDTGGGTEPGIPALLLLTDKATADLEVHTGEVGAAKLPAETAILRSIVQHEGSIDLGEVTLTNITKNGGTLTGDKVTMSGELIAR